MTGVRTPRPGLHLLPRHRLLAQTGGFEGFGLCVEGPQSLRHPSRDLEHIEDRAIHLYSAGAPPADEPRGQEPTAPQKDVIVAKADNDTIHSKSNDDRVCLGDGNDFAVTSRGFDKIDGGDGRDVIHGGGKKQHHKDPGDGDLIIGGEGNDFLDGTRGELDGADSRAVGRR